MATFKVTMRERAADGTIHELEQTAICESEKQVIDFYGLNEPDIVNYKIEKK